MITQKALYYWWVQWKICQFIAIFFNFLPVLNMFLVGIYCQRHLYSRRLYFSEDIHIPYSFFCMMLKLTFTFLFFPWFLGISFKWVCFRKCKVCFQSMGPTSEFFRGIPAWFNRAIASFGDVASFTAYTFGIFLCWWNGLMDLGNSSIYL